MEEEKSINLTPLLIFMSKDEQRCPKFGTMLYSLRPQRLADHCLLKICQNRLPFQGTNFGLPCLFRSSMKGYLLGGETFTAIVSDYCLKLPDFSQSEKFIGHLHMRKTGTHTRATLRVLFEHRNRRV